MREKESLQIEQLEEKKNVKREKVRNDKKKKKDRDSRREGMQNEYKRRVLLISALRTLVKKLKGENIYCREHRSIKKVMDSVICSSQ